MQPPQLLLLTPGRLWGILLGAQVALLPAEGGQGC